MEDYSSSTRLNGVNTTGMAVMLSNSGNALATATAVKEKLATLQKYFRKDELENTLRYFQICGNFD